MGCYPLGIVKEFVEEAGMAISYAYEDLVFVEHNAFLLQFVEGQGKILLHINRTARTPEIAGDIARLRETALARGIELIDGAYYIISQEADEQVRLAFVESV